MKSVCVVLTDGFEEAEAVATFAILRRAGLRVTVFSLQGTCATGRFGLTCSGLTPLEQLRGADYDALVLPGGPQYAALEKSPCVQELLQEFMRAGKVVAAICASPTILGRAGYLKGKNYTCFTAMNEDFGGHFTGQYTTTDGNLVTGQSAAASIDFGLAIAEKLLGPAVVTQVKQSIYYKG